MVRITAELVNAADGSTLWSQRYDRPYTDLFALQDDITTAVATALKAELLASDTAATQTDRPPSGNLAAWNAYSQGKFAAALYTRADFRKAIGFYPQATTLDPRYARAYAAMAIAWANLAAVFVGGDEQRPAFASARAAADRALQLDSNLAAAHDARGVVLEWADLDWQGAEAEYRCALELAPNDGLSKYRLSDVLGVLGRPQEAIVLLRQVVATDPRDFFSYAWLAWNLAAAGQMEEAEQAVHKAMELAPGGSLPQTFLVIIEIQRGDAKAALAAAQREPAGLWRDDGLALALQIGDDRAAADAALNALIAKHADAMAWQIAMVYAVRKDPDNMFEWLDRAWANRDPGIGGLLTDPFIQRYKDDPRFAAFCRKVGLPVPGDIRPGVAGSASSSPLPASTSAGSGLG